MGVRKCDECGERFNLIETGGGQPYKPESDDIECPYCKHQTWEKTTGVFTTEKSHLSRK